MSEDNGINSAILTATMASLKLLKQINDNQTKLDANSKKNSVELAEFQRGLTHTLQSIQQSQTNNQKAVDRILALPKPKEFNEIKEQLQGVSAQLSSFDFDGLVTALNTQLDQNQEHAEQLVTDSKVELESQMEHQFDSLSSRNTKQHDEILQSIHNSDKADNVETIKTLIGGLVNMQDNLMKLAERVTVLSKNVTNARQDSKALSKTIIENNARIRSMDLRMAMITNDDEKADAVESSEDALALLKSLPNESNGAITKLNEMTKVIESDIHETGDSDD